MNLDNLRGQAAGFVAAQIEKPFLVPEVREVSSEEIVAELAETSQDLLARESAWKSLLRPLESSVLRFLSGRIMGLYTQRYRSSHTSVIMLQSDNLDRLSRELGIGREETYLWVLSHEMFHAAQMDPDLPLQEDIQRQVRRFLETREGLTNLRAAYTWIEGSADWVMDQPGLLSIDKIEDARRSLNKRRQQVSWASILLRILGNKTAQYSTGRLFVQEAISRYGKGTLLLPAYHPELLPKSGETPEIWSLRIGEKPANSGLFLLKDQ